MKPFKYYTLGYAEHKSLNRYAIYQPVLDCFIFCLDSLLVAQGMKSLLSSRYDCMIVCLNTAENYSHNLVDNMSCEQWTLDQRTDLCFSKLELSDLVLARRLKKIAAPDWWDIDREKQWCFLLQMCLKFLHLYKQELLLTDLCFLHYQNRDSIEYQELEQRIISTLYMGRDFATTDQEIRLILQQVYDRLRETGSLMANDIPLTDFFQQQDLNLGQ